MDTTEVSNDCQHYNTIPHLFRNQALPVRKTTTAEFKAKAIAVHKAKYTYDNAHYTTGHSKLSITCPEHGDFLQTASSHLIGRGCPGCKGGTADNQASFIAKASKKYGGKFDYSKVVYIRSADKVCIICRDHGEYWQAPNTHLAGVGCPGCWGDRRGIQQRSNTLEFIQKAREVHGDRYEYGQVEYSRNFEHVAITCRKHGIFHQRPDKHLVGNGCTKCTSFGQSKGEIIISEFVRSLGLEVIEGDRKLIGPLELDILIPEKKIAIEFNGVIWHSDKFKKDRQYHANKTKRVNEAGYRLIHIWEDALRDNEALELKFISNALGFGGKPIYARRCTIAPVGRDSARDFLNLHHVQGFSGSTVNLGTFHDNTLVGVTQFKKHKRGFELTRHACSVPIVGGLGKVAKHFANSHDGDLISFCDLARYEGGSYIKAGFEIEDTIKPDYMYVMRERRFHKFGFRRKNIQKMFPDIYSEDKTEREMMVEANIPRIYDCGKIRFVYKKRGRSPCS